MQSIFVSTSLHSIYFLLLFAIRSAHGFINRDISLTRITFTGSFFSTDSSPNCFKISSLNFTSLKDNVFTTPPQLIAPGKS